MSVMEFNVGVDVGGEVYVIVAEAGEKPEVVPFDAVMDRVERYALNLFVDPPAVPRGSQLAYDTMVTLRDALRDQYERTGEQAVAELSTDLFGYDGRRVRVRAGDAEWEFTVGRTEGFLPHHEEVTPNGRRPARAEYDSVEVIE